MSATIAVPSRFNGPLEYGNGGYSAGLLAAHLEGPAAEVSLRSPVPLDQPLEVVAAEGEPLRAMNGETLVAEARPLPALELEVPAPVGVEEARRAAENYRAPDDGVFSQCFVCGRAREDCFEVFAGRAEGRDLVATPWTPPEWTAGDGGEVRPEFVWATLDCPTYFAAHLEGELTMSMLVRQRTELRGPVEAGAEHVVIAWPIEADGRKRLAASAVLSSTGETLALAEVLLVEARSGR
ncbi:MAG TPA: hypothetical protein VF081_14275 [Solirubrobacterales bacterium]